MSALPTLDTTTLLPLDLTTGGAVQAAHVLAFDTSTEALALGVCGPAGSFAVQAPGGAAASATLLPRALQLLDRAGLRLQDLQALAFGSGPGAFTGLRTACAVAQGLGLGLGIPVVPVDSLMLVAEDARLQLLALQGADAPLPMTVDVVMDARMNEVYAGRYLWTVGRPPLASGGSTGLPSPAAPAGSWQVLQPPQLYSLAGLARWGAEPAPGRVVAGSALLAFADRWPLPAPAPGLNVPAESDRARALLRLALTARAAGQSLDPAQALPLYGRDKVAQTTLERDQARAAAAALSAAAPLKPAALS